MYTRVFFGKEELVTNALGEKEKGIVYANSFFYCEEKSIKYTEFYQAMQTGLSLEKIIVLNKYEYYKEKNNASRMFAKVEDSITQEMIEHTVVREYSTDSDNVELTLKRGVEHVSA